MTTDDGPPDPVMVAVERVNATFAPLFCVLFVRESAGDVPFGKVRILGGRIRNRSLISELLKWIQPHVESQIAERTSRISPITGSRLPTVVGNPFALSFYREEGPYIAIVFVCDCESELAATELWRQIDVSISDAQ